MNEPVKFRKLQEIASELKKKLDDLHTGSLSRVELEKLTEESRELYERLVVLRFNAYKEEIPPAPSEPAKATESERPAINFRISDTKQEPPVQVSLIDIIEEVVKAEPPADVEPKEGHPAELASTVSTQRQVFEPRESLHDRLAKGMSSRETLAQKLEHHPIPDLKRAISLNQRFQFSRELFKGNNQDYEVAIERLNSVSREEAIKHLDSLRSKYAWNNESPVALDFTDLVARRHQEG